VQFLLFQRTYNFTIALLESQCILLSAHGLHSVIAPFNGHVSPIERPINFEMVINLKTARLSRWRWFEGDAT